MIIVWVNRTHENTERYSRLILVLIFYAYMFKDRVPVYLLNIFTLLRSNIRSFERKGISDSFLFEFRLQTCGL